MITDDEEQAMNNFVTQINTENNTLLDTLDAALYDAINYPLTTQAMTYKYRRERASKIIANKDALASKIQELESMLEDERTASDLLQDAQRTQLTQISNILDGLETYNSIFGEIIRSHEKVDQIKIPNVDDFLKVQGIKKPKENITMDVQEVDWDKFIVDYQYEKIPDDRVFKKIEDMYHCVFCNKKYTQKNNARRHYVNVHQKPNRFMCKLCTKDQKYYSRIDHAKDHCNKNHYNKLYK